MKLFDSSKSGTVLLFLSPLVFLGTTYGIREGISYLKSGELMKAIETYDNDGVLLSLSSGANPNAVTTEGWSMIMWAVGNNGNVEAIKMLQNAGAKTNASEDLFIASLEYDIEGLKSALRRGANVNAVEKDGWTPLIWAACRGNWQIVDLLIKANSNVNHKNSDGKTALYEACGTVPPDPSCFPGAKNCRLSPDCERIVSLLEKAMKKK